MSQHFFTACIDLGMIGSDPMIGSTGIQFTVHCRMEGMSIGVSPFYKRMDEGERVMPRRDTSLYEIILKGVYLRILFCCVI